MNYDIFRSYVIIVIKECIECYNVDSGGAGGAGRLVATEEAEGAGLVGVFLQDLPEEVVRLLAVADFVDGLVEVAGYFHADKVTHGGVEFDFGAFLFADLEVQPQFVDGLQQVVCGFLPFE